MRCFFHILQKFIIKTYILRARKFMDEVQLARSSTAYFWTNEMEVNSESIVTFYITLKNQVGLQWKKVSTY